MPPVSDKRRSLEHQVVSDCLLGWRRATQQRTRQQKVTQWTDEEYSLLSKIRQDQATKAWGMGLVAAIGVFGFLRVAPVKVARAIERSRLKRTSVGVQKSPKSPFSKTENDPKPWFRLTLEENRSNMLYYWGWVVVDLSVAGFCGNIVAMSEEASDELTTNAKSIFPPSVVPLNGPYAAFHCPLVEQGIEIRREGGGAAANAVANPETEALRSLMEFYNNCRSRNNQSADFPMQ